MNSEIGARRQCLQANYDQEFIEAQQSIDDARADLALRIARHAVRGTDESQQNLDFAKKRLQDTYLILSTRRNAYEMELSIVDLREYLDKRTQTTFW